MQMGLQNEREKYKRLAELKDAERIALARWEKEINHAEQERIYSYLTLNRQVAHLVHFTPTDNLQSIMRYGILPRSEIENRGIIAKTPDATRYDYQKDYSSFSVSFPNYLMFYNKRKNTDYDYVVLLVDPGIILDVPLDSISYLPHNAASRFTGNAREYVGEKAVKDLFRNIIIDGNAFDREVLGIPPSYTTNPQAEVFIRAPIPPKYIQCVVTENSGSAERLRIESSTWKSCKQPDIICNNYYYRPRSDYRFWMSHPEEE